MNAAKGEPLHPVAHRVLLHPARFRRPGIVDEKRSPSWQTDPVPSTLQQLPPFRQQRDQIVSNRRGAGPGRGLGIVFA
jgi:hypothetical protein